MKVGGLTGQIRFRMPLSRLIRPRYAPPPGANLCAIAIGRVIPVTVLAQGFVILYIEITKRSIGSRFRGGRSVCFVRPPKEKTMRKLLSGIIAIVIALGGWSESEARDGSSSKLMGDGGPGHFQNWTLMKIYQKTPDY